MLLVAPRAGTESSFASRFSELDIVANKHKLSLLPANRADKAEPLQKYVPNRLRLPACAACKKKVKGNVKTIYKAVQKTDKKEINKAVQKKRCNP